MAIDKKHYTGGDTEGGITSSYATADGVKLKDRFVCLGLNKSYLLGIKLTVEISGHFVAAEVKAYVVKAEIFEYKP